MSEQFKPMNFTGKEFNPNKNFNITPEINTELERRSQHYAQAYKRYGLEVLRADAKKVPYKNVQAMGAYCGSVWNWVLESNPIAKQEDVIKRFNELMQETADQFPCNPNAEMAGFKGEFAAGCLMRENNIKVTYSDLKEDLYSATDWRAANINGQDYGIQVKTLSLDEIANRKNSNIQMPVFSRISTPEEAQEFKNQLSSLPYDGEFEYSRIAKLNDETDIIRDKILKLNRIPIICLLGSPDSGNSDISFTNARPTALASAQAKQDWEMILKSQ